MILVNARPTVTPLLTTAQVTTQLGIDTPDPADPAAADLTTYLADLIDAATEHAEEALGASLLTRTITATYLDEDVSCRAVPIGFRFGPVCYGAGYLPPMVRLELHRGPVQSVTMATDANGVAPTRYQLGRDGRADFLAFAGGVTRLPLTVVYAAGYGPTPADVPADLRMAIRTHVASLWRVRGSVSDRTMVPVPHSLEAFYAAKRRTVCVA